MNEPITMYIKGTPVSIYASTIDEQTMGQITQMGTHPACTNPVAVMPDCHFGAGCCVGFTMKVGDLVVPNWVGCDIGCGMLSAHISHDGMKDRIVERWEDIDKAIRNRIPMGFNTHNRPWNGHVEFMKDFTSYLKDRAALAARNPDLDPAFAEVTKDIANFFCNMDARGFQEYIPQFFKGKKKIDPETAMRRFSDSLGTLGGGNHFIEIGESRQTGDIWMTIHSGSRNFGLQVANHFHQVGYDKLTGGKFNKDKALKTLKLMVQTGEIQGKDIPKSLEKMEMAHCVASAGAGQLHKFNLSESAYVEKDDLRDYLRAMFLAQCYATMNRDIMYAYAGDAFDDVGIHIGDYECIECTHNFISFNDGILRKGAISAHEGERLVVPLTPKDGIIIGTGKGNPEWNCSAPHGAGRVMGRNEAKRTLSQEDIDEAMKDVLASVKPADESPLAYKDATEIMQAVGPTMEITDLIRPIINIKAG